MPKRYKVPKGYPGYYPPPPHIDLAERSRAIRELKAPDPERTPLTFRKRLGLFVGSYVLKWYIQLAYRTAKLLAFDVDPEAEKLIADPKGQFIIAIWHNRLMLSVYSLSDNVAGRGHDVLAIISQSSDGELIARATKMWGAYTARGSSSRGGTAALKKILKYTKLHFHPLITPDGPRGPVYVVKEGLPAMARLTGLPIVPICYDASKKWITRSWDKFIIPKLFSKTVLSYGAPIYLDKNMPIDEACTFLQKIMMQQVETVEKRLADLLFKETG
ncbi:MAG: lysophospholipid acyltransferase family protein [Turneriella sp.]